MNIALLTQHGKETLLAPLFAQHIGARLFRVAGFDTDTLGTFTLEVARSGTQLEAAQKKAELALSLSDADFGLGSEGAFHPDPQLQLLPWNTEMLVLIERQSGQRLIGIAQGAAQSTGFAVRQWEDLVQQLPKTGFPQHHLVLRRSGADGPVLAKGIADLHTLQALFAQTQPLLRPDETMHIENDLRAHTNPTRQAIIQQAGLDLLQRFIRRCPGCQARGWSISRAEPGAPCALCHAPTRQSKGHWWACAQCGQTEFVAKPAPLTVDPSRCDHCNP